MEVVDLGMLDTGRPAIVDLWYPEGRCAPSAARYCLADSAVTRKVVVLSHGSMGSTSAYSWLGESLAREGLVVVGVNHYGESSVYGEATRDLRSAAFTWQRAQGISALLTRIAAEPLFQKAVDWNTVVAIGHSAGGQTVSLLAGARYDLRQLGAHCGSEAGKSHPSCNYGGDARRAPDSFVASFDASYQDTRVRKIVLLDPAMGSALRQESLDPITLPSLFTGSVRSEILPWKSHGAPYVSGIAGMQNLRRSSGHAEGAGKQDRRVRAHERRAADHCQARGEGPTGARDTAQRVAADPSLHAALGLLSPCRAHRAQIDGDAHAARSGRACVAAPRGTVSSVVERRRESRRRILARVGSVATGMIGTCSSCLLTMRPGIVVYDANRRTLAIAGSWMPILMILGIFCIRYAMGAASGMGLDWFRTLPAQLATNAVLGAFSGFFVARGLFYWRTIRQAR